MTMPSVRAVTKAMIQQLGHQVIEAESGGAALDIFARGAVVDAIVIDYAMPAMNGVELAERVRQLRPGVPVLLITGLAELDRLRGGSAADFVLRKPFKASDLAAKLDLISAVTRAN